MASYLRSWLTLPTVASTSSEAIPTFQSSLEDEDEGSDTEREDNDAPPAFPSLNSAQRMQSIPTILTDSQLMPPPPDPKFRNRTIGVATPGGLAVPPTTTKPPVNPRKKREKVALAPGHSPLDWAALKSSGKDLRVRYVLYLVIPKVHRIITNHLYRE